MKPIRILGIFTFLISPLAAWASVIASDETAVFASLSRMIWYSGDATRIFFAMLVLFIPMIISFFFAHENLGISKRGKFLCRLCMIFSCIVLYIGAMEVMPSDGKSMTTENIWHGILSFGGMLDIFMTYCLYIFFAQRKDRDGCMLLAGFLLFTLITGAFAILNVFDADSYVVASAVSELYVLTMFSIIGYLTYFLSYRTFR